MLRRANSPTNALSIKSMLCLKKLKPTTSSADGISSMQTPWDFEGSGFVLLRKQRVNSLGVSSSSLSFPCKWRASALKRQ